MSAGTGTAPGGGGSWRPATQDVDLSRVVVYLFEQHLELAGRHQRAAALTANLTDVEAVLHSPAGQRLLDLGRPVGIIATGMLPYLDPHTDPAAVIAQYRHATVAGSQLVVSHLCPDSRPHEVAALVQVTADAKIPVTPRTTNQIAALLAGWDLIEPGLGWAPAWGPDPDEPDDHWPDPAGSAIRGAVARHPGPDLSRPAEAGPDPGPAGTGSAPAGQEPHHAQ